jgi:hypothetical protein
MDPPVYDSKIEIPFLPTEFFIPMNGHTGLLTKKRATDSMYSDFLLDDPNVTSIPVQLPGADLEIIH